MEYEQFVIEMDRIVDIMQDIQQAQYLNDIQLISLFLGAITAIAFVIGSSR